MAQPSSSIYARASFMPRSVSADLQSGDAGRSTSSAQSASAAPPPIPTPVPVVARGESFKHDAWRQEQQPMHFTSSAAPPRLRPISGGSGGWIDLRVGSASDPRAAAENSSNIATDAMHLRYQRPPGTAQAPGNAQVLPLGSLVAGGSSPPPPPAHVALEDVTPQPDRSADDARSRGKDGPHSDYVDARHGGAGGTSVAPPAVVLDFNRLSYEHHQGVHSGSQAHHHPAAAHDGVPRRTVDLYGETADESSSPQERQWQYDDGGARAHNHQQQQQQQEEENYHSYGQFEYEQVGGFNEAAGAVMPPADDEQQQGFASAALYDPQAYLPLRQLQQPTVASYTHNSDGTIRGALELTMVDGPSGAAPMVLIDSGAYPSEARDPRAGVDGAAPPLYSSRFRREDAPPTRNDRHDQAREEQNDDEQQQHHHYHEAGFFHPRDVAAVPEQAVTFPQEDEVYAAAAHPPPPPPRGYGAASMPPATSDGHHYNYVSPAKITLHHFHNGNRNGNAVDAQRQYSGDVGNREHVPDDHHPMMMSPSPAEAAAAAAAASARIAEEQQYEHQHHQQPSSEIHDAAPGGGSGGGGMSTIAAAFAAAESFDLEEYTARMGIGYGGMDSGHHAQHYATSGNVQPPAAEESDEREFTRQLAADHQSPAPRQQLHAARSSAAGGGLWRDAPHHTSSHNDPHQHQQMYRRDEFHTAAALSDLHGNFAGEPTQPPAQNPHPITKVPTADINTVLGPTDGSNPDRYDEFAVAAARAHAAAFELEAVGRHDASPRVLREIDDALRAVNSAAAVSSAVQRATAAAKAEATSRRVETVVEYAPLPLAAESVPRDGDSRRLDFVSPLAIRRTHGGAEPDADEGSAHMGATAPQDGVILHHPTFSDRVRYRHPIAVAAEVATLLDAPRGNATTPRGPDHGVASTAPLTSYIGSGASQSPRAAGSMNNGAIHLFGNNSPSRAAVPQSPLAHSIPHYHQAPGEQLPRPPAGIYGDFVALFSSPRSGAGPAATGTIVHEFADTTRLTASRQGSPGRLARAAAPPHYTRPLPHHQPSLNAAVRRLVPQQQPQYTRVYKTDGEREAAERKAFALDALSSVIACATQKDDPRLELPPVDVGETENNGHGDDDTRQDDRSGSLTSGPEQQQQSALGYPQSAGPSYPGSPLKLTAPRGGDSAAAAAMNNNNNRSGGAFCGSTTTGGVIDVLESSVSALRPRITATSYGGRRTVGPEENGNEALMAHTEDPILSGSATRYLSSSLRGGHTPISASVAPVAGGGGGRRMPIMFPLQKDLALLKLSAAAGPCALPAADATAEATAPAPATEVLGEHEQHPMVVDAHLAFAQPDSNPFQNPFTGVSSSTRQPVTPMLRPPHALLAASDVATVTGHTLSATGAAATPLADQKPHANATTTAEELGTLYPALPLDVAPPVAAQTTDQLPSSVAGPSRRPPAVLAIADGGRTLVREGDAARSIVAGRDALAAHTRQSQLRVAEVVARTQLQRQLSAAVDSSRRGSTRTSLPASPMVTTASGGFGGAGRAPLPATRARPLGHLNVGMSRGSSPARSAVAEAPLQTSAAAPTATLSYDQLIGGAANRPLTHACARLHDADAQFLVQIPKAYTAHKSNQMRFLGGGRMWKEMKQQEELEG